MAGFSDTLVNKSLSAPLAGNTDSPNGNTYYFKTAQPTDSSGTAWLFSGPQELYIEIWDATAGSFVQLTPTTDYAYINGFLYIYPTYITGLSLWVGLLTVNTRFSVTLWYRKSPSQLYSGIGTVAISPTSIAAQLDITTRLAQEALESANRAIQLHPSDGGYDAFTGVNTHPTRGTLPPVAPSARVNTIMGWVSDGMGGSKFAYIPTTSIGNSNVYQMTLTALTGTAPFVISSTTVSPNLNAQFWNGGANTGGASAGNASGNIPLNNSVINTGLVAQYLGLGGTNYPLAQSGTNYVPYANAGGNLLLGSSSDGGNVLQIAYPLAKTSTTQNLSMIIRSNEALAGNPFNLVFGMVGGASDSVRYASLQTGQLGLTNAGSLVLQPYGGSFLVGTTTDTGVKSQLVGPGINLPASSGANPSSGTILRLKGSDNANLDFGSNSASGMWIQSTNVSNLATTYSLLINPSGGNVLIGTTTDNVGKLQVGDGTAKFFVAPAGASGIVLGNYNNQQLSIQTNNVDRLVIAADGRIYGTALHNNGAVTGTTNQYIASGTYTPTITSTVNITSNTPRASQWIRVGNVVTVSSYINITTTSASVSTSFEMSLPIASNFNTDFGLGGTGVSDSGAGIMMGIYSSASNKTARFVNSSGWVSTAANAIMFTFTYVIL